MAPKVYHAIISLKMVKVLQFWCLCTAVRAEIWEKGGEEEPVSVSTPCGMMALGCQLDEI